MPKVKTSKVRFSYAKVFKPSSIEEGGELKYSVSLLIPKSDKALVKKIKDAIELAKKEGSEKFGDKFTKGKMYTPLRDGDEEKPDDENYEGMFFVNASSKRKPGVIDKDLEELYDDEEFYSGCFGRASVNFYPFNVSTNKGIACGLNNLQKLEDGERLGGGAVSAADDFKDDDDGLLD